MSEIRTNAEIEDVLSSIRRLVSKGERGDAPAAPAQAPRLVLTPALRIAEAPREAEVEAEAGTGADEPLDLSVLDLGPHSDPAPQEAAARPGLRAVPDAPAGPAREHAEEPPRAGESDIPAAGPMAERPGEVGEGAPDGAEGGAGSAPPEESEDDAAALEAAALRATIAELESAVTRTAEAWEPDGSEVEGRDLPRDWSRDWARDEGAAAFFHSRRAPAQPDSEPVAETPAPDAVAPALDEAALRGLVADVLREELAGELGERITRNVRRLVRREIARALASQ
ncbi:hypothetical protein [Wenxinia saemankumensis]|uniref:Cell pole-organizing protein PopZ n=1 Tax=Wenxinia saemankumensis TaxID=1447782 RepID=A0A1M6CR77_9RHOB|nr:hypothetical protein [Wenxinia saemankumensis]SHI63585.1 hypothetical protein SAMN05444417_1327 [Wenxinia saemankumensis]